MLRSVTPGSSHVPAQFRARSVIWTAWAGVAQRSRPRTAHLIARLRSAYAGAGRRRRSRTGRTRAGSGAQEPGGDERGPSASSARWPYRPPGWVLPWLGVRSRALVAARPASSLVVARGTSHDARAVPLHGPISSPPVRISGKPAAL